MNLGFEYILRNDLAKNFLRFPFSVFLGKSTKAGKRPDRMTSYVDRADDRYIVKQWILTDCEKDQALPPMNEFYIQSLDEELGRVIPEGFRPIQYIFGAVVDRQNTWRKPMSDERYNDFSNDIFDSMWHSAWKSLWLWETFCWVYFDSDKKKSMFGGAVRMDKHALELHSYPIQLRYMQRDLSHLADRSSRLYEKWRMWDNQIYPDPMTSHGELAFSDAQRYFDVAKRRRWPPLERYRPPKMKSHAKPQEFIPAPTVPNPWATLDEMATEMTDENKKQLLNAIKQMKELEAKEAKKPAPTEDYFIDLVYVPDGN